MQDIENLLTVTTISIIPIMRRTLLSLSCGCIKYSTDDFIVAGTAAQISSQPVSDFMFRRIWVLIKECFRTHDETRGANTALERGVFKESILDRMQFVGFSKPFNGLDRFALSFYTQDEARIDESAVEDDAACPTVPVIASLFCTCKVEFIPEDLQQALPRFTEKFHRLTIDSGLNV